MGEEYGLSNEIIAQDEAGNIKIKEPGQVDFLGLMSEHEAKMFETREKENPQKEGQPEMAAPKNSAGQGGMEPTTDP